MKITMSFKELCDVIKKVTGANEFVINIETGNIPHKIYHKWEIGWRDAPYYDNAYVIDTVKDSGKEDNNE